MSYQKNSIDKLREFLDAVEEDILRASDEDIIEETKRAGEDPEAAAQSVQQLIDSSTKRQRQKKLRTAREGYNRLVAQQRRRISPIPSDPAERRALLDGILANRGDVPREITMAFREGGHMSDDDVSSILEDLAELGFLSEKGEGST